MKIIELGFYRLKVDDEDFSRVLKQKWTLTGKDCDILVNSRHISIGRFILRYNGPLTVDHKDRDIWNNQKINLRIATRSQQQANKGPTGDREYKGTSYHKRDKKYQATLEKDGRLYFGGYYKTEIEAAYAYDKLAKEHFGEFAYLNFPPGGKLCPL